MQERFESCEKIDRYAIFYQWFVRIADDIGVTLHGAGRRRHGARTGADRQL